VIEDGSILLSRGPKENRHRPAVDPLFRSAAIAYGERVVSMIVSGTLDDGAAGTWWVKHQGGVTIVQHPEEAVFPQMPRNALERASIDYVVRTSEMAGLLTALTRNLEPPSQSPLYGLTAEELAKCKRKNS
jgi:two-component system chemotaxis response regulator CheB